MWEGGILAWELEYACFFFKQMSKMLTPIETGGWWDIVSSFPPIHAEIKTIKRHWVSINNTVVASGGRLHNSPG